MENIPSFQRFKSLFFLSLCSLFPQGFSVYSFNCTGVTLEMKVSNWTQYLPVFLPLCLANPLVEQRAEIDAGIIDASACAALGESLSLENVTVNFVNYVSAGTNITFNPGVGSSACSYRSAVVKTDMCRVAMAVKTSERSQLTMEAWLPTNWTGRFLSTGNGGLQGCIQYPDLAYTAGLGFATVGTNNGHDGTSGLPFANNPEVVHDFVDRAMHIGVVIGKQVSAQYYGTAHTKSYYLGCSTGGRQGFKAIQTYPEDFDGVVAGAPAFAFPNLTAWSGHFYPMFGNASSASYIPAGSKWQLVHQEVLKQCDAIDGIADGILEDPNLCHFRPESLQCVSSRPSTNTANCLTKPQVKAVREALSDYLDDKGNLIYPRLQPGAEILASNVLFANGPFPYTTDWFRYVVYNDSTWDPATFNVRDAIAAAVQNPYNIMTWEGDLSAFQTRGGKVLHYHGLADFIISSDNSPRYHEHVSDTMNLTSSELDDFYRLFRVSGMGHCNGGLGAHNMGQQGSETSVMDPQNNVLLRMVDWVENGGAPVTITGTKYVNDDKTQGVSFVRNHCRYPLRNTCIDPENYTKSEAWKCV
ncbi:tannase and feruloyl esterase-domain-containing protein [Amylocarpus encephaloides]|uniref:Carboxylic ester hydrolase n=1 Tax=Amylocarpus encephaloides TaxID=45428 RepID=A0A9P7YJ03_9HELO|nr:tannase and feruloyl esterase-domain-containing protein [Amylocarpus encephaloides]